MRKVWHAGRIAAVLGLYVRPRRSQGPTHEDGIILRFAIAILLGVSATALATPPADIRPDPELALWFKSLRQPTTRYLCCSISDCRFVNLWVHDGHYEVEIDGWRYTVPD